MALRPRRPSPWQRRQLLNKWAICDACREGGPALRNDAPVQRSAWGEPMRVPGAGASPSITATTSTNVEDCQYTATTIAEKRSGGDILLLVPTPQLRRTLQQLLQIRRRANLLVYCYCYWGGGKCRPPPKKTSGIIPIQEQEASAASPSPKQCI